MDISKVFPIYEKLEKREQELLRNSYIERKVQKGTVIYNGEDDCLGVVIVTDGQLRAYITSEDGRQITLYRLLERDMCLFSASCMMRNIQFDVMLSAEKDTTIYIIPAHIYKQLSEQSLVVAKHVNELMAARFTDVMWLMEQVMWKSFDKRLASFLIEESNIVGDDVLHITHEKIADHLGSAREVVTRMLRHFQSDGLVKLSRGAIELLERKELYELAE